MINNDMTFKEFLIQESIMSHDALKQASGFSDKLGIGQHKRAKPANKRKMQTLYRRSRKQGKMR
jgi:hypothetical protein